MNAEDNKSWETNGYDKEKRIRILDNYTLIDGKHRFTVATYFGQKSILGDVYNSTNKMDIDMIPDNRKLYRDNLLMFGFTVHEIDILDEAVDTIIAKFQ